jgi:hypothetical protein
MSRLVLMKMRFELVIRPFCDDIHERLELPLST